MIRSKLNSLITAAACFRWLVLSLAMLAFGPTWRAQAGGTWAPLVRPPPGGLNNALLLGDGTVMCGDGGQNWYRLTPDIHGSYINGTWTVLASTHYTRLFFSSQVLTNGNVYVAGGEYGTGGNHAELYNSLNNTWSDILQPAANPTYSDAVSKMLPNGNVLQGTTGGNVWIYNVGLNSITAAATARNQNEACWVRLPNDSILTIDAFGMQSEHYVPSLNSWINDGNVPVSLYGFGGEMGAGFLLPNGNVFYIGGSTHTAIYTPGSTASAAGTWIAGPDMIFGGNSLGAVDAPAAMMLNGKILCALGPTNGFNGPTSFYEYDYVANGFTQVNGPTGLTFPSAPFPTSMLDLPDGGVLYISGQGTTQLYIYTPDGVPLAAGQPVINSITENADGSYHLTGTGLNGISGGAAYGDDWQMDSNYPLVRMTNNTTGNIYYARTYGWNSTGVMTSNRVVTTEFTLPPNLPAGTYSLSVLGNGNPSLPYTFNYAPLAAPTGLSASIGNTQLRLAWNPVPGATAYVLKRSTVNGSYYVNVATTAGTNFTNSGLTNGTTYYYVVTSVGSGGPSAYSSQLAVAPFGPPPAPTGLTAGPNSFLGVSLSWNPSVGATNYNVKRTTSGSFLTIATRSNTDYEDTNVVSGTTYFYAVSAVGPGGESANSASASATPTTSGDVLNGLAGNWRFDENGGTVAADSSGNNNTGTLVNAPGWVAPGRQGASALSFVDVSQQSVTVANAASLNMSGAITIAAWINPIDWTGNRRILQKGNSDNQYRLLAENGVFKFHLNPVGTLTCPLPPTNTWTHVAATYNGANGTTMSIYINGVLQASGPGAGVITTTADPLAIGKKNGGTATGDFFNGTLDEVRLYNRALSVPEINTVMHAGDGAPTTPTGLSATPGNAQVTLSWTASSAASSYSVKRATISGGPYTIVGTAFGTSYTDRGLANGTTYYYVISAVNNTNESPDSTQVSAIPGIGVVFFLDSNYNGAATRILSAGNYTLSQLTAAGSPNDSASSCRIPNGWTVIIYQNDNFLGTSWTLTTDTPNFTAISGLNDNMSSCKIMAPTLPPTPTGLSATRGDAQVSLSWNVTPGATSYSLKRSTTSGGPYAPIAALTSTGYLDTGVVNGTTYYYVVSALNANGESANSAQASATPIPPVVLTVGPQTNGQFTLQFPGVDGQTYVIETSTNLFDWSPIFTNQPTGGTFIFTETNAIDPARFYRSVQ